MVSNTSLTNFMAYNTFVSTSSNLLANSVCNSTNPGSLSSLYNPVVSSVVANAVANSTAGVVGDHRSSSIAALRLKAREHSVALGTI